MSETYGSNNLRTDCLNNKKGKNVKDEQLLLKLYDYWNLLHAEFKHLYYPRYHPKKQHC